MDCKALGKVKMLPVTQDDNERSIRRSTITSRTVLGDLKKQLIVGTGSACFWITASHPFDTIKTRLQLAKGADKKAQNVFNFFRNMIRSEGILSIWRGVSFPLTTQALKGSLGWFGYNSFSKLLRNDRRDYINYSYFLSGIAGALSGLAVSGIVIPSEVLKIRMQGSNKHTFNMHGTQYRNSLVCMKTLIQNEGPRSLFTGTTATFGRLSTAWFFYYSVQECFEDIMKGSRDPFVTTTGTQSFVAGGLAGMVSWLFSMPFDTLKTRIQMHPDQYTSLEDCLRKSIRSDGIRSLYQGFNAVMARAFVANAMAFWSYRKCSKVYDELGF